LRAAVLPRFSLSSIVIYTHTHTNTYYFNIVRVWLSITMARPITLYLSLWLFNLFNYDFTTCAIFDLLSSKPAAEIIRSRWHIIIIIILCYYVCISRNELQCFSASNRNEFSAFGRKNKIIFMYTIRSGLHAAPLPFMIHLFYVRENGYT